MPRPKPDEPHHQVGLRLPVSMLRRADLLAEQLRAQVGLRVTRTDALKLVLDKGLPPLPPDPNTPVEPPAAAPVESAKPSKPAAKSAKPTKGAKPAKRTAKRKP